MELPAVARDIVYRFLKRQKELYRRQKGMQEKRVAW